MTPRNRELLATTLAVWLLLFAGAFARAASARELLTFDPSDVSQPLSPFAKTKIELWRPESSLKDDDPVPSGRALRLSGSTGSGFVTTVSAEQTDLWRTTESLAFWLHRSADEAKNHPTIAIDVRLIEEDRKAFFWRRVDVSHTGWAKIILPLDWFLWSEGRIPTWRHVRSIAFRLSESASLSIDTVWTISTDVERGDFPSASNVARVAFPQEADHKRDPDVRTLETADVQLLTNAPLLDLEQLAGHLATVTKEVRREMPFLPETTHGPLLAVLRTRDEYRQFIPRYARQLNGQSETPNSTGFTIHGVSCSFWDEQFGSLRPVFTHEFLHGYLSRTLRIPCDGDWLHEGLATHFQLQFHPQTNLKEIVSAGLRSPKLHAPLKELCNGKKISASYYWQSATLCQMLLVEERYREQLPKLFQRFRETATLDLAPHLEPVWQTNWDLLTNDWRAFCQKTFAK